MTSSTLALTPALVPAPALQPEAVCALLAVWWSPGEPPRVERISDPDPAAVIEALCDAVADRSPLPAPAVREAIENLVHAGFDDAVVSLLDDGRTLRVSDHGPGIADPARALEPGFTSAGPDARRVVRGVGGGLPLAAELMARTGGRLEIEANLGGGAAVTLRLAGDRAPAAGAPDPGPSEQARLILALLLEMGRGHPEQLSRELGIPRGECGRELVLLGHRGLVARDPDGARRLTESGEALVATLF
jgi:anti-sigma regulatory factor (Ser/Thr protein kinase)